MFSFVRVSCLEEDCPHAYPFPTIFLNQLLANNVLKLIKRIAKTANQFNYAPGVSVHFKTRNGKCKHRTHPRFTFGPDASVVFLNKFAAQNQTQSCTSFIVCSFG